MKDLDKTIELLCLESETGNKLHYHKDQTGAYVIKIENWLPTEVYGLIEADLSLDAHYQAIGIIDQALWLDDCVLVSYKSEFVWGSRISGDWPPEVLTLFNVSFFGIWRFVVRVYDIHLKE